MFTTQIYLYDQTQTVVLNDTSSDIATVRWQPVYSKNLKISKGTDNVLNFTFINQDQKKVDISSATFTWRLIDREGENLLLEKTMVATDATNGKAKVTITEQDLNTIDAQRANYSIEKLTTSSSQYDLAFVDDNNSGRGVIEIQDSLMPKFTASESITIPDGANSTTFSSSTWEADGDLQTLQYVPSAFTGNLTVQGAVDDSGQWYTAATAVALTASSTTGSINISGYHPKLKVYIEKTSGSITSLTVR